MPEHVFEVEPVFIHDLIVQHDSGNIVEHDADGQQVFLRVLESERRVLHRSHIPHSRDALSGFVVRLSNCVQEVS